MPRPRRRPPPPSTESLPRAPRIRGQRLHQPAPRRHQRGRIRQARKHRRHKRRRTHRPSAPPPHPGLMPHERNSSHAAPPGPRTAPAARTPSDQAAPHRTRPRHLPHRPIQMRLQHASATCQTPRRTPGTPHTDPGPCPTRWPPARRTSSPSGPRDPGRPRGAVGDRGDTPTGRRVARPAPRRGAPARRAGTSGDAEPRQRSSRPHRESREPLRPAPAPPPRAPDSTGTTGRASAPGGRIRPPGPLRG